jgi:MYXO-CTERM domain-containing protein
MVKRPLHVEFVSQQLTSYSGLELLRRYLRQCELPSRLRAACAATGGDYGGGRLALLILALFYVGARRLEHLRYVAGDPLIARFCGLARIPTARTVGNWLRQFTQSTVAPLVQLNHDLVIDAVKRLALPRLTLDVDGTVVRTGATVGWAVSRLQSASPERSQLLPPASPRGPDRAHPASEESARQRA